MPRIIIPDSAMELVGAGNWINMVRLSPLQTGLKFPCEMVHRRNHDYCAAKCLRLVTEASLQLKGDVSLPEYCQTLGDVGLRNFKIQFLAMIRPFTFAYSPSLSRLTVNYQIELPGGIMKPNESVRVCAVREGDEEGGMATLVQSAPLMRYHCPFDAGTHVEMYSIYTALVQAKTLTPTGVDEGVISGESKLIPLLDAEDWLHEQESRGVPVEGYVHAGMAMLLGALHGGWKSLA